TADEVFFYGVNSKSELLTIRLARSTDHKAEALIRIQLSNGKLWKIETSLFIPDEGRWRIFFNGLLRETSDKDAESQKMVHVKFALMWRATTDAFDFLSDINNKILATGLAKVKWNTYLPPVEKLYNALNCYAQCGVIMGTLNIAGMDEELNLYLFGEKLRFLGDLSSVEGMQFSQVLGNIPKNGRFVHLAKVSIPNVVEKLTDLGNFGDMSPILAPDWAAHALWATTLAQARVCPCAMDALQ
ncbi:phosphoenolpyruvate synthase, partial [Caerostris extrusa]